MNDLLNINGTNIILLIRFACLCHFFQCFKMSDVDDESEIKIPKIKALEFIKTAHGIFKNGQHETS